MRIKLPEKFGTQAMKDGSTQPVDAFHKRLSRWEAFDEISLKVVPRYKTSDLSGDEWRTSVFMEFKFKGEVVHEQRCSDIKTAIMLLGHEWLVKQEPIPDKVIELEEKKCDQPGCANDAISTYIIKRETSLQGDWLDPEDCSLRHYRRFCKKHLRRGDCGREDSDRNYDVPEGPGEEASTNIEESPSAFERRVHLLLGE